MQPIIAQCVFELLVGCDHSIKASRYICVYTSTPWIKEKCNIINKMPHCKLLYIVIECSDELYVHLCVLQCSYMHTTHYSISIRLL